LLGSPLKGGGKFRNKKGRLEEKDLLKIGWEASIKGEGKEKWAGQTTQGEEDWAMYG